jgi:superfamily II DNA/RNA helicase
MTMSEPRFDALGLRQSLRDTLASLGYEMPTPIQARTIPAAETQAAGIRQVRQEAEEVRGPSSISNRKRR